MPNYYDPNYYDNWGERFADVYGPASHRTASEVEAAHINNDAREALRRAYEDALSEYVVHQLTADPAVSLTQRITIVDGKPTCGCRVIKSPLGFYREVAHIVLCDQHTTRVVYADKPEPKVEKKPVPTYPQARKILKQ